MPCLLFTVGEILIVGKEDSLLCTTHKHVCACSNFIFLYMLKIAKATFHKACVGSQISLGHKVEAKSEKSTVKVCCFVFSCNAVVSASLVIFSHVTLSHFNDHVFFTFVPVLLGLSWDLCNVFISGCCK